MKTSSSGRSRILKPAERSRAAQHRLHDDEIVGDVLANQIQREQRMTQVIEHAHEPDDVKALGELRDLIHGHLAQFDLDGG
jgi:hypothetical protein